MAKEYNEKLVHTPKYNTTSRASERAGYTAPDIELSADKKEWWRDAKLGMFIHWGLYAVIGKGEWDYFHSKWDREEYAKLTEQFNPTTPPADIAREWMDVATSAGVKYAVMVTRHHDGFAMWPSDASYLDFNAGKTMGKDYVGAYVTACREAGVHPGVYYSPMDWRFPGYFDPEGLPESAQAMKAQCHAQVKELMTRYGKLDVIWFDGGWLAHKGRDMDAAWLWDPVTLCRTIRESQPDIMISPRCGYVGDFLCDEGAHEIGGEIIDLPWEKCMTTGDAWGYQPGAMVHPIEFMVRMFVNVICRGGNMLLNIGPDPDGHVPEEVKALFRQLGEFTTANAEAIYGTRAGIWQPVDNVFGSVQKDGNVYLHILDAKAFAELTLPAVDKRFASCATLDGREVSFTQTDAGVKVDLPADMIENAPTDLVLKLTAE